jgi:hypothetical protein
LRTKFIILACFLSLLNITGFSQGQSCHTFLSGPDNYQSAFFNPFFYDDFSYRFSSPSFIVNNSFGKRISIPYCSVFSMRDSVLLDSIKAVSNIYLVLGTQKNQALQLENLQRIGKSTFLYLNYNSVASFGFLKNSASRNRSFILNMTHVSKWYRLNADLLLSSNYDATSGGISDSVIPSNYSKRDLKQLDVNLSNDFLKKKYFKVELLHQFNLLNSSNGEKLVTLSVKNNYSNYGYLYSGDGFNSFYENVFNDSSVTKDTCGFSWFKNEVGITTKLKSVVVSVNAINDDFNLQMLDSLYHFNDWSVNADLIINGKQSHVKGSYSKNISDNFRRNNANAKVEFLYRFRNSIFNCIEFQSEYNSTNVPFVYQKQFSNHYRWNLVTNLPIEQFSNIVTVGVGSNLFFKASSISYTNRVYLNDKIIPEVSNNTENLHSFQMNYNDTIGKIHFVEAAIYNISNSSSFPVIPIQSFTRIGYMFSLFKSNLKVEAGVSGIYNDAWYATSYSPALDDFYLQSEKKFGGLAVFNVFADFKIKSATLFVKVERLNIGWIKENSFIRDGYIAPPRTIRFGFNWPLKN